MKIVPSWISPAPCLKIIELTRTRVQDKQCNSNISSKHKELQLLFLKKNRIKIKVMTKVIVGTQDPPTLLNDLMCSKHI